MSEQPQATSRERWPLLEGVNWIEMLSYLGTSTLAERVDSGPPNLAQLLVAHGWARLREGVGMAVDLSAIASPFPPPPGLTIERVVDEEGVTLWGTFHRYQENDQRDESRERLYISLGLAGDQPLRHYIARLGGEPVGALSLFLGQEAAGLYNVEVADHWQRRGVGTAMTNVVLEEACKLGYHVGVLGPTRESRSMYERLGFILHRQALPTYHLLKP